MLGVGHRESAAVLQSAQAEQQQLLGQQPIALGQARVAREVDQHVVKFEIERVIALDVLLRRRLVHVRDDRLELTMLLRRRALGDPLPDQFVERLAHVIDFVGFGDRDFTHEDAAILLGAHQAGLFERSQAPPGSVRGSCRSAPRARFR